MTLFRRAASLAAVTVGLVALALALARPDVRAGGAFPRSPAPDKPNATPATLVVLAEYDFEDGMGGPDAQGWTSHDVSGSPSGRAPYPFTHIDDFAGMGGGDFGGYTTLEGNQSLWIGVRAGDPAGCRYQASPGYGHSWWQNFESIAFAVTGDVTISGLGRFDSEQTYDFTHIQYVSRSNVWRELGQYDQEIFGTQFRDTLFSHTVPADSLDGTVRFRFHFRSDGGFDDEDGILNTDGAAIIDSLTIADAGGVVDFQDFESEAVGAKTTLDGHWIATQRPAFGDYAGMFDGALVLQEDSLVTNTSHLWGFFNNSPANYACAGHPQQAVVPFGITAPYGDGEVHIRNEIWSPVIPLGQDIDGNPIAVPDSLILEYDVYADLPDTTGMYYHFRVRVLVDGCWQRWDWDNQLRDGGKEWVRQSNDLSPFLRPGATHLQVALAVRDMCGVWCGVFFNGECHTHAPLFDNVRVSGVNTVSAVKPEKPANSGFALYQNIPNPFNPTTTIRYTLPAASDVTLSIFDAAGRRVRTLVATSMPEGVHDATWDGTGRNGNRVASGVYFYRLEAGAFTQTRKMLLLK